MGWRDLRVPVDTQEPIETYSRARTSEVVNPVMVYESYPDYDTVELSIGITAQRVDVPKPMYRYVAMTVFNTHATQIMYVDIDRLTDVLTGIPVYALQSVTIPCRVREFIMLIADGAGTTGVVKFWRVD